MIADYQRPSGSRTSKEIGTPTCNGGLKKDIRRIFTAETAIEGLTPSARYRHYAPCDNSNHASRWAKNDQRGKRGALLWEAALILIGISIVLTMLAGLIPSRIAAK